MSLTRSTSASRQPAVRSTSLGDVCTWVALVLLRAAATATPAIAIGPLLAMRHCAGLWGRA